MKKKKTSHFSVEDIIRNEFKKSLSRGTIGKDANGLLWAYGVLLRDSLYWVEVITIDLETHKVERIKEKESSYEQREDATAYIKGLTKEILPMDVHRH
ncbi:MAG TPA: hypothetical protein VFG06_03900 [Thermodesulfovibrionales bacterium]|jgi:hypothetical protein|nr:hypothetical protein [Thermodesulfovibrionales bacterium]HZV46474.1 hypothetical protein [Thermodesulfovibrionales bacterium]